MLLYSDVCTGDELFTDSNKIGSEDDDFIITVTAKMKTQKAEGVSEALIGGNASAEDPSEADVDDPSSQTGLDLVLYQKLEDQSAYFATKKVLQGYLKKFVKNVVTKLNDNEEAEKCGKFKKDCTAKLKSFLDKFEPDNDTIFCGPSFDPEECKSCPMIGKWDEDGMGVTFYMMKGTLYEEKA